MHSAGEHHHTDKLRHGAVMFCRKRQEQENGKQDLQHPGQQGATPVGEAYHHRRGDGKQAGNEIRNAKHDGQHQGTVMATR